MLYTGLGATKRQLEERQRRELERDGTWEVVWGWGGSPLPDAVARGLSEGVRGLELGGVLMEREEGRGLMEGTAGVTTGGRSANWSGPGERQRGYAPT